MARHRYLIAFGAGVLAYLSTLYRFLSYSERNRLPASTYEVFATLTLIGVFLVTLGMRTGRYRTVSLILVGIALAHLVVLIVDVGQDATTHNLLPFEFVILWVMALPAYVGAAVSHLVGRLTNKRPDSH